MKKTLKKTIATILCAVLLTGIAPLNGFVGLELPQISFPKLNIHFPSIKLPDFSSLFTTDAKAQEVDSAQATGSEATNTDTAGTYTAPGDNNPANLTDCAVLSGDEGVIVAINRGELTYIKYIPERTGKYIFYSYADDYTYACLYDSEMHFLTESSKLSSTYFALIDYNLTAGETYYFGLRFINPYNYGEYFANVVHMHIDSDTDDKCDICGSVFRYSISEDEPVTVSVPSGSPVEFVFACERTGEYRFNASEEVFNCLLTDSHGNSVNKSSNGYLLTAGETYYLRAYGYLFEDDTVTAVVSHAHIDNDGDDICDICGIKYKFALIEDALNEIEVL